MERYNKAEILRRVEEEDVEFIRLQFTDMFGMIKNIAVPSSRLVKVMENRYSIDLASLDEIARILIHSPSFRGDRSMEKWQDFCVMYAGKTVLNMRRAQGVS